MIKRENVSTRILFLYGVLVSTIVFNFSFTTKEIDLTTKFSLWLSLSIYLKGVMKGMHVYAASLILSLFLFCLCEYVFSVSYGELRMGW